MSRQEAPRITPELARFIDWLCPDFFDKATEVLRQTVERLTYGDVIEADGAVSDRTLALPPGQEPEVMA